MHGDGSSLAPSRELSQSAELPALLEMAERLAADPTEPVLADDRSGLYESIVDGWQAIPGSDAHGLELGGRARKAARAWIAFLEAEVQRASTKEAKRVFDAHRVEAYLATGALERARSMLAESERDFPLDYNIKVRIARVELAKENSDAALVAIDRALALVRGPRMIPLRPLRAGRRS
jgi:hypothetical protein